MIVDFPAPLHPARTDQAGSGRPPHSQLRRLGAAELHVCIAALRPRRACAHDGRRWIDAAWLTSAAGMCADLETSKFVNDKAKKAERDYPGRFIGAAHAHPLGGGRGRSANWRAAATNSDSRVSRSARNSTASGSTIRVWSRSGRGRKARLVRLRAPGAQAQSRRAV